MSCDHIYLTFVHVNKFVDVIILESFLLKISTQRKRVHLRYT